MKYDKFNCCSCASCFPNERGVDLCRNEDCRFYLMECSDIINSPDMKDDICIFYEMSKLFRG
jgi:hypothetical protein